MFNLIVVKVAFRNIFLYRMKTLIVGSILVFGAFIAVLGNSVVNAISDGMKNSITESVTGDLQIYSKDAKEKLSVFGNMDGSPSDIESVKDFKKVQEVLSQIPNVKSIVPLGTNGAMMNPGNLIDVEVEKIRGLFKLNPQDLQAIQDAKEHLHFLIQDLKENENSHSMEFIATNEEDEAKNAADLNAALAPEFWDHFNENFESRLEFIGNKIAPQLVDENMLYFSYLGTNPLLFKNNFEQFEIVKGEMIPQGKKGFLIHDYIYETYVKHRIARRLDAVKKEMKEKNIKIADTKALQDKLKANLDQLAEIYLQLNPAQTKRMIADLNSLLKSDSQDFNELLKQFFTINDANFNERYEFFYTKMAPELQLYKIKVGETIPLTAFTKLGSSSAMNIKVYGTFRFKSFENSPLAGNFSLIDLVSFRQLYGFMTDERKAQNKEIESEMGAVDLSKDDLEGMFGKSPETTETKKPGSPQLAGTLKTLLALGSKSDVPDSYSKEELENGVFLNAAIFLKDASKAKATMQEILDRSEKEKLGIQVADWQESSGMIGQMTFALKFILYFFVFILLSIASLMIMNSLLMATLDRQQEIGTIRAIGAPKNFIYSSFLIESALTSLLFGGIGTLLALLVIQTVGKSGIPAQGDVAMFFFSGPKLYFSAQWFEILLVFVMMLLISFLATQYPAWRAMKISPILAMQKKD